MFRRLLQKSTQPGRRRGGRGSWWIGRSGGGVRGSAWGRVRRSPSRRPPSSTPPTPGLCLHLDSGDANVTVRQKYRSSMIQDKPDRKRELGGRWGERNEACLLVFTPWKVDIIQAFWIWRNVFLCNRNIFLACFTSGAQFLTLCPFMGGHPYWSMDICSEIKLDCYRYSALQCLRLHGFNICIAGSGKGQIVYSE